MNESIIERQIGILRTIQIKISEENKNGSENLIQFTNKYFGFNTKFGWNILMNAFFIFEDTELIKKDFKEFELQGPCRHKNTGEKYLRLYGILNSMYQQFLATKNLMELFKLPHKKPYIKQLQKSSCIELRNKIASHSSNYLNNKNSKIFNVYEISREGLENGKIRLIKNQADWEYYDLVSSINDFNNTIQEVMSKIIRKFIEKKFNNQGKYYEDFQKIEQERNISSIFENY